MFVSKEQAALNRDALLQAASRLFREKGIDGVGVAEIAKEAGLTHGALYKHFSSKDVLAAEALAYAAANKSYSESRRKQSFEERLDAMFSIEHRDNIADRCPMTASASEIARQGATVAASFALVFKAAMADVETSIEGRMPAAQKRQLAISVLAAQIGAMAVARALAHIEPSFSEEVLRCVHETVKAKPAVRRTRTLK
jgi:TetR/AcrR family transcriptional regulator, transcriptional repressor for nem operon